MGAKDFKKCKRCGEAFDIGTNCDLCPTCRMNDVNKPINLRAALRNKKEERQNGC